ncbi:MAG: hypothetical protein CSA09_00190 [Candidatus Contendobacter odensis]|uniref:Periplasmic chaperone PpiD n=1 Tax=Candidatus Contendibacter odensensis TaxID=1400860 RepID=A0A2G6PGL3_9GAMM|nr:MAG: hypothetical protein CSA09_00190 [Candidatus Contendobacter odensis]
MLLQKIRDGSKGWLAYIIVGFLTIPFAIWGINYYFEGGGPIDAANVGGSKISLQEFQRAYQQQRQQIQAMLGDQADSSFLEGTVLKKQVLNQLINERVLDQFTRDQGLRASDQQLHGAVMALPLFQNGFDKAVYGRLLHNQGYTAAMFEEGMRQSIAIRQLRDGLTTTALVTPTELDRMATLLKQQRELQYLILPLAQYADKATIDDAAIQDYFEKNKTRFMNPEQLQLQWVDLKLANIAKDITVADEELRAVYQEQISKYSQPEERQASHILIRLADSATQADIEKARTKAQKIADDIHARAKSFDAALKEARADTSAQMEGGKLGTINKDMFDNPAFEDALFALKNPGDVSEPVRMPSGFHIIRLDGINPAKVKPFEKVRKTIDADLRQQQAENQFYEIAQTLANTSYEQPDSLEPVARILNLEIQNSDWIGRSGGTEGIAAQPKVIESAFSEDVLKRGLNSQPIELDSGHVVVIRVKAHKKATPRTLEESRAEITELLRNKQAQEAIASDVKTVKMRAARGEHLQKLAKEFSGEYKSTDLINRDDASVDRSVLNTAFRLPKPQENKVALGEVALENGDQVILEVMKVVPGKKNALSADERKALNQQLIQQTGLRQFQGLVDSIRAKTSVVVYEDRL